MWLSIVIGGWFNRFVEIGLIAVLGGRIWEWGNAYCGGRRKFVVGGWGLVRVDEGLLQISEMKIEFSKFSIFASPQNDPHKRHKSQICQFWHPSSITSFGSPPGSVIVDLVILLVPKLTPSCLVMPHIHRLEFWPITHPQIFHLITTKVQSQPNKHFTPPRAPTSQPPKSPPRITWPVHF